MCDLFKLISAGSLSAERTLLPTLSQSPFSRFLPWDEKEQEMRGETEMNFAAMG